jgi:putative RNA 2'-phosphotransferase
VPGDRATELSKLVSYALRHEPWQFELELDRDGWVAIEQLVDGLRREPGWDGLEAADLERMVADAPRRRHELHGGRIRALYGHSAPVAFSYEPATDLGTLYHGTSPAAIESIRRLGLQPRRRRFVHLATGRELAERIGRRKAARPVVLEVDAKAALAAGVPFYRATGEIVLADGVPATFLR